ncbi:MAG TPA: hypothetical protein VFV37_02885 [Luteibaculaceae bacterium]|nr:hypothetical protein [Luteibaculaceae bacterium]
MQFKSVIGQSALKGVLLRNVQQGRISHAQLFAGSEGFGSLALALAYISYVLCENPGEDDSCGQCSSCLKNAKFAHPDVHYTFPFIAAHPGDDCSQYYKTWREMLASSPYIELDHWLDALGAEGKQAAINKKEASRIAAVNALKAYEGRYKITLIWKPELLHAFGANALLKLIEEPPENTLFLLVSAQTEDILPTILSRTQRFQVPRIEQRDLVEALQNQFNASPEVAIKTANMGEGSFLACAELLSKSESALHIFEDFRHWMRICYGRKVFEIGDWVEKVSKSGRENIKQFLQYGLLIARQCINYNYLGEDALQVLGEERDFVIKFSPFINERTVIDFSDHLNAAYHDVARNGNARIILLDLSFKAFVLFKK